MVFKQEWRSYSKTLLIWAVCVEGLYFVMLLMFPQLRDTMKDVADLYKNMGAFSEAFGMDKMNIGTVTGFYGTYVGAILSIGGGMFAAMIGTSVLAKEEGGHTAEYLFTLPYSRKNIVIKKMLAIASIILVFEVVGAAVGLLGVAIVGGEYSVANLLLFHVGQMCMHLELASIGILISAYTKRVNVGVGLGIALLMYFLDMMSRVLDQLKVCKYITPFYYANASDVLVQEKIDMGLLAVGGVVTVVCLVTAITHYNRKDLAA